MGEELSLLWGIPFVGILLSIALFPLFAPHWWHRNFHYVSVGFAALLAVPFLALHGGEAWHAILHIYVIDYIPFVILLWSLFTISGGIALRGTLRGTPTMNTILILVGTAFASWIGTTGASMLLIRPLLKANAGRHYKTHTVVFFIFLVSNIGGSLTPLGDPPLFLGFLHSVPFFWTLTNMFFPMVLAVTILAITYFCVDTFYYRRESEEAKAPPADTQALGVDGSFNFLLLACVVGGVLLSGYWKPKVDVGSFVQDGSVVLIAGEHGGHVSHGGDLEHGDHDNHGGHEHADEAEAEAEGSDVAEPVAATEGEGEEHPDIEQLESHGHDYLGVPIQNIARDLILILAGLASLWLTPKAYREANGFNWFPIKEVAWLFAGIFMTIVPVLAILQAGSKGQLGLLIDAVDRPYEYFWVTGVLSSFLDNAPTYLTFFNTALGQHEATVLATQGEPAAVALLIQDHNIFLEAIAVGAVFMGANTYIGNAPNFMVRSIAEEGGVRMPSFFGYILLYSLPFLIPTFVVVTLVFFL